MMTSLPNTIAALYNEPNIDLKTTIDAVSAANGVINPAKDRSSTVFCAIVDMIATIKFAEKYARAK